MIKRRFYHVEHGDGDSASSSSSSDSEEIEPEERGEEQEENDQRVDEKEEEEEEKDGGKSASENPSARSSSSGYESEDSSGNEINCDSSGLLVNDYEEDSGKEWENLKDNQAHDCHPEENKRFVSNSITKTVDSEDSLQAEMSECILKCKSVFKCRICPRIVCLSEDTLLAHLKSKRHARSKKLLGEGRLKLMLNSDGEIEEEEETHAERHARTVALLQPKKKNKGRQRQNKRRKTKVRGGCDGGKIVLQKARGGCDGGKSNPPQKKQKTKRSKIED